MAIRCRRHIAGLKITAHAGTRRDELRRTAAGKVLKQHLRAELNLADQRP
ncbi:MAG: hypothetical protein J2P20_19895 [Pseudonocardia sp.]|nr:hypothetical protein [Pseudonocardia sp.]